MDAVRSRIVQLSGDSKDYDALLADIGDAVLVMMGDASHGITECHRERVAITKRLIEEKGFSVIVSEADCGAVDRAQRYISGASRDSDANEALSGFQRYPRWMWRNKVTAGFIDWAKDHNERVRRNEKPNGHTVCLYGFDLHGLRTSMTFVLDYLAKTDKAAAEKARRLYSCLEQSSRYPAPGLTEQDEDGRNRSTCADCVREVLNMVHRMKPDDLPEARPRDHVCYNDEHFMAVEHAVIVKNAEAYYRTVEDSFEEAWNVRDVHMFQKLTAITDQCSRTCGGRSKVILWAHNCHVSDARQTEISWKWKSVNSGQLAKEAFGDKAYSIGFCFYTGSVMASPSWGEPGQKLTVPPSAPGSFDSLMHEISPRTFMLNSAKHLLPTDVEFYTRSIGIIYNPEGDTEHYFLGKALKQFDEIICMETMTALEPLGEEDLAGDKFEEKTKPETYPIGI